MSGFSTGFSWVKRENCLWVVALTLNFYCVLIMCSSKPTISHLISFVCASLKDLSHVQHAEWRLPSNYYTLLCRFQGWILYFIEQNHRQPQVRGVVQTGIEKYHLQVSMGSKLEMVFQFWVTYTMESLNVFLSLIFCCYGQPSSPHEDFRQLERMTS